MSESWVHFGGRVVRAEEARVSPLDAGFLYGDGIYETMRAYGGRAFALSRHLARLARSAARIGLKTPPREDVARAVEETIAANGGGDLVVRLTITRGRLRRRLDLSSAGEPSMLVTADPVEPGADAERRKGIRVVRSRYLRWSRWPLAGAKTTNYLISLLARNEAREAGVTEVLLADETGAIVEGAASNVFAVERGRVLTPPLSSGILGGVTRDVVLELAREARREVVEESLAPKRLDAADELFLTGTTIQVAPVVRVGDRPVGGGAPGPVALDLLDRYLEAVARDTGAKVAPPPAPERR